MCGSCHSPDVGRYANRNQASRAPVHEHIAATATHHLSHPLYAQRQVVLLMSLWQLPRWDPLPPMRARSWTTGSQLEADAHAAASCTSGALNRPARTIPVRNAPNVRARLRPPLNNVRALTCLLFSFGSTEVALISSCFRFSCIRTPPLSGIFQNVNISKDFGHSLGSR